jgi:hypothetical protein
VHGAPGALQRGYHDVACTGRQASKNINKAIKQAYTYSPSAAPLEVALAEGTQNAPRKPPTNLLARSAGSHVLLLKRDKAYYNSGVSISVRVAPGALQRGYLDVARTGVRT